MRRRDKPLDIYKKLQIVRAIEDLVFEDEGNGTNEKSYEPENFKTVIILRNLSFLSYSLSYSFFLIIIL